MVFKKLCLAVWMGVFLGSCAEVSTRPEPPTEKKIVIKKQPPPIKVVFPETLKQLPAEVSAILAKQGVSQNGLSVYIQSLSSPKALLSFNPDIPRNPASVMKLITTYAALDTLGENYRWQIELYTSGRIVGNTLQGNLILKGYGYPDFKQEDLRSLLTGLRARGIVHITGNLIFDNSYFSLGKQNSAAFDNKPYTRYNALPDALLYNQRISDFFVKPQGKSVHIYSETPSRNVKLINQVKLKNVKCRGRYAKPQISIKPKGKQVDVYFKGTMSSRCGEREYSSVISDPANMLFAGMRRIWINEMRGSIKGKRFIIQQVPRDARLVYAIQSKPVSEILPLINKKSNNVMARQLFLSIAAKKAGMPATNAKGSRAIQHWLLSRGLSFPELRIENGSGLSRRGQITAKHIGELLRDAYQSSHRKTFLNSLAIMGVDGTLKKRMRGSIVAKKGRFKTGTLKNVRGIAGYVKAMDGETYVIAILHNDPKARYRTRTAHDKLIEWTANQRPRMIGKLSTELTAEKTNPRSL